MSQAKEQQPKSILNPAFRYTPSQHTDIRKTFERARKEMKQQQRRAKNDR